MANSRATLATVGSRPPNAFTSDRNVYLDEVLRAEQCAAYIELNRDSLVAILTRLESHEAAEEEVDSSIDALRNVHRELANLRRGSVSSIAVFLPINLPLYSLVLFAAIPSLMADRVDVRLPAATPEWVTDVAACAGLGRFFPRVALHEATRRQFITGIASQAAAVVFTGRHESAEDVREQCSGTTFVFQGSGVNPVVVGPSADLADDVMARIVTSRVFNSGQDCAAPDAFLVHESRAAEFVGALVDRVGELTIGDYTDPAVRIGPIANPQSLKPLEERMDELKLDVVVGGTVDRAGARVDPTVVVRPIAEHDRITEFFAPIFYVLVYDGDADLARFFGRRECVDNAMYVSLFGQDPVPGLCESSTVLFNRTVLDVEQGNSAFGGNGCKSNYVAYGDEVVVGPGLITEALAGAISRPTGPREHGARTNASSLPQSMRLDDAAPDRRASDRTRQPAFSVVRP